MEIGLTQADFGTLRLFPVSKAISLLLSRNFKQQNSYFVVRSLRFGYSAATPAAKGDA
ncbi:hypothetical protein [Fournierella sp.]|uniref:hypothetical protein n=1 Tax=Allofournierella sp. TaxID=1940256 RepID=UPI0030796D6C